MTSGTTSAIINDVSWTVFKLFGTFWGRVNTIYINGAWVDEPSSPQDIGSSKPACKVVNRLNCCTDMYTLHTDKDLSKSNVYTIV